MKTQKSTYIGFFSSYFWWVFEGGVFRADPVGKRTCELVVREWETEGGVSPRLNTDMEPSNELAISVSFSLWANINLIIEKTCI